MNQAQPRVPRRRVHVIGALVVVLDAVHQAQPGMPSRRLGERSLDHTCGAARVLHAGDHPWLVCRLLAVPGRRHHQHRTLRAGRHGLDGGQEVTVLVALVHHEQARMGADLDQRGHDRAVAQLGADHQVLGHQSLQRVSSLVDDLRPGTLQLTGDQLELLDPRMADVDGLQDVEQMDTTTTPRRLLRRGLQRRQTVGRHDADHHLPGDHVPHGAPPRSGCYQRAPPPTVRAESSDRLGLPSRPRLRRSRILAALGRDFGHDETVTRALPNVRSDPGRSSHEDTSPPERRAFRGRCGQPGSGRWSPEP